MSEIEVTGRPPARKMTVDEFRESGYLQELNRQFLHPLGLALGVRSLRGADSDGGFIAEIFDARDDPEGWVFAGFEGEGLNACHQREDEIAHRRDALAATRQERLGFVIQPVEDFDRER